MGISAHGEKKITTTVFHNIIFSGIVFYALLLNSEACDVVINLIPSNLSLIQRGSADQG